MSVENIVIGHFSDSHRAAEAITALRAMRENFADKVGYFSPFPDHHLEDAAYAGRKRSPVRRWTLLGGLTGCLSAFLFCSWMSLDYPLRVSAKPLVSVPSFVVIAFECTILLGAIFTLLGMFVLSRIPNFSHNEAYRPEFSEGVFGVTVRVPKEEGESLRQRLQQLGADKVEVQYVR